MCRLCRISEFASIPDIQKALLPERLPDRLFTLLQEKTKKKLMKEKPSLVAKQEQAYVKSLPPKKKDFLTIDLSLHVHPKSFRNLTKTASQSPYPSLSTL